MSRNTTDLRDPNQFPENCWIFQCTQCGCGGTDMGVCPDCPNAKTIQLFPILSIR